MKVKFYVAVLGGNPCIKEVPFGEFNRLLSMYDGIQDVKSFSEEGENLGVRKMQIFVSGSDYQILFIRKVWEL